MTGEFVRIGMFPIYVHNVACYNASQHKPGCLWTERCVVTSVSASKACSARRIYRWIYLFNGAFSNMTDDVST